MQGVGTERAIIFQEPRLLPWLTVLGNVAFGLQVRGTSINRQAKEGDILFCLDISAGWQPEDGNLVIVERRRDQDGNREVTAKRFRRRGNRIELWPESDDPRWQEPIVLEGEPADRETVHIIAHVEWVFRNMRRP